MPDKTLVILIIAIIGLTFGHDIDHFFRGDYRLEDPAEAITTIALIVAKFAILGFALFLYLTRRVGPGFWAIFAGIGVILGWLAHFSPFTDQPAQAIYGAYETPLGGVLAVAWFAALMLALIVTTLYAQYLWARASN
jgi:hypothetical protein